MKNWIGKRIGKCKIEEKIGVGGMGAVYKAKHLFLDKSVALKILHSDLLVEETGEEILKRFIREARSAAKLEHPNIIPIYDIGEENGLYFIMMQFVSGQTLLEIMEEEGKFSVEEVLRIGKEIAKGLEVAHNAQIIHRDIKPANIILTEDNQVKITDFGMARQVNDQSGISQTGRVFGTPLYLSPEQAMGEKQLDGRADLYSLGVTLFQMITGKTPFNGKTSFLIMQQHVYNPIPAITTKFPYVPKEVEYLIHKLLAKKRDARFSNAREVIDYIEYLEKIFVEEKNIAPNMESKQTKTRKNLQQTAHSKINNELPTHTKKRSIPAHLLVKQDKIQIKLESVPVLVEKPKIKLSGINSPEKPISPCNKDKLPPVKKTENNGADKKQSRQVWRKGLLTPKEWIFLIVFVIGCLVLFGLLYIK